MAECNLEENLASCNCTYEPCDKKGRCCDCVAYHRALGELPACYFDAAEEKTYDRSIAYFVRRRSG
jgi:hypothetical protein